MKLHDLLDSDGNLKEEFEDTYWYVKDTRGTYRALIHVSSSDDFPEWYDRHLEFISVPDSLAAPLSKGLDAVVSSHLVFQV